MLSTEGLVQKSRGLIQALWQVGIVVVSVAFPIASKAGVIGYFYPGHPVYPLVPALAFSN